MTAQAYRRTICTLLLSAAMAGAQTAAPQHTRLFLQDGSYQLVLGYEVVGDRVRYQSAERNGETEDLPLAMVDLAATKRWQQQHGSGSKANDRAVLSPELAVEEALRHALTPEVAPNLRLVGEDSVLALDSFQAMPELVPVAQEGSDLNRETAHAVQPVEINPAAVAHEIAALHGASADVQLHSRQPLFYVRIGDDADLPDSGAMVVDTHGNSGGGRATPTAGTSRSRYVVVRLERRQDLRALNSFKLQQMGTGHPQEDTVEVQQEPMAGGRWLKLTPTQSLEPGEYALIEVLNGREVNLDVWDFGVDPAAKESYEAIKPSVPKPAALEHRHEP